MPYPDPRDPSHMFAYVRDKISIRPGFSEASLRVDISDLINEDPWKIDIVLTESPDDLAARFIKKIMTARRDISREMQLVSVATA